MKQRQPHNYGLNNVKFLTVMHACKISKGIGKLICMMNGGIVHDYDAPRVDSVEWKQLFVCKSVVVHRTGRPFSAEVHQSMVKFSVAEQLSGTYYQGLC